MKYKILLIIIILLQIELKAQLVINEVSTCNKSILFDEEAEAKSWFELYNNSGTPINLSNYYISDNKNKLNKFRLPDRVLGANQFQLIYASSKNRGAYVAPITTHHWETVVQLGNNWKYKIANGSNNPLWRNRGFNDATWAVGASGIGYGDGDDNTIVPSCFAVFMRYSFTITDTSKIVDAILHMDYDDGFVAYLNGVEIARANLLGYPPNWNEAAADHEAILYTGAPAPTMFMLNKTLIKSLIQNGINDLAIEIHNADTASADLTAIPTFSVLVKNGSNFFSSVPSWFSTTYTGNIHANFQISNAGETLYLINTSNIIVDSLVLSRMNPNESKGRYTDGTNTIRLFDSPTPEYSNIFSTPYNSHEIQPTINTTSGIYSTSINVSITNNSTSGGVVHYTTNGQDPILSSPIYSGPITITNTTILKARCFGGTTVLPSTIDARSYIFNSNYTVPIYCITADSSDLYGWSGIIDNPWTDYKIPCHIDIFDIDHSLVASQNSSIRIDGGAGGSRGNPQRSFRLDFDNNNFGESVVNSVLIPAKPHVDKYSSVYLRNGSNFWNSIFFKEAFMERVSRADTFAIYNAYRPVVVILNGQYFGLYELREKYTDTYFKNNFGADKDSVDILSVSYSTGAGIIQTLDGSSESWFDAHRFIMDLDTTHPAFLNQVNTVLDSRNFADYMAIENYWANYDWIWNNMKFFRMNTKDKKWRFALQDMEWGFAGWGNYWDNMFNYMVDTRGYTYNNIYFKLLQNPNYKNFYINRYADLLNTDMLPDTMKEIFKEMWQEALPEWNNQILRWQDPDTLNIPIHMNDFKNLRNTFSEFIDLRPEFVRDQLINNFDLTQRVQITLNTNPPNGGKVRISTVTAPYYPWSGIYFDGNSVDLEATANPGYVFANWDTSDFIVDTALATFQSNVYRNTTFTANFIYDPTAAVSNQPSLKETISIYPNPSNTLSYIEMPFDGEKTIYLYNSSSSLLDENKTNLSLAKMNVGSLSKGFYIIKVNCNQQTYFTKLVVE